MKRISWYDATTIEEAQKEVNATTSDVLNNDKHSTSIFKSGGIDIMDLLKEGLIEPEKIVNLRNISGLDQIEYDSKEGLKIGANVTLASVEENSEIIANYRALHLSVAKAATPQLRNMSTIAGNLGQRTRCWYFRSIDHHCFRKGGNTCFAQHGENEYHAVMNNGTCASVHASSVATSLMAFGARIEVATSKGERKQIPIESFFITPYEDIKRENALKRGDIITAVILPPVSKKTRSYYIKQGARASYDWALADVAVVLELVGNKCKDAKIVLGAASPVPLRSDAAEAMINGKVINVGNATAAGDAAMERATPLEKNAYKVAIFKAIVKRAILKTV